MKLALLGNPNTGKSSVFNLLTGMRQKVANFPGITVDKKVGEIIDLGEKHYLIDFPGTYSLYPRSKDEEIVFSSLCNDKSADYPDVAIVVLDASNLERNLLFFSQVYDLQLPTIMVLNMTDLAKKRGKRYDINEIQKTFPESIIVETNARVGIGKERILAALSKLKKRDGDKFLFDFQVLSLDDFLLQEEETKKRFDLIKKSIRLIEVKKAQKDSITNKIDSILTHRFWGYLIFTLILITIFQFVFSFASTPMDLIDRLFMNFSNWTSSCMPEGPLLDLITEGIIPGIGGVIIFLPQIVILFFFISILEETGYLSRVVFIMDRLVRPIGLNGRSIVPLLSSAACAIPGIMSTRTISNWKERIITIMVAPLISCSARIPVYTLLITLVIPNKVLFGFINLQGIVLFSLYVLGVLSALCIAFILKHIITVKETGSLILEMPEYRYPHFRNIVFVLWEKVKLFVWDAGKIILSISIILWALASYGPSDRIENAIESARLEFIEKGYTNSQKEKQIALVEFENSYIGIMGKTIEPIIKPLGYDWKIGVALITSFAAREVFVGSMATIYAIEDDGRENKPLIEKMRQSKRPNGSPVYTLPSGVSLMVFYAFAMQCMATLAVVKRETKSWKWPVFQVLYMGILAYLASWITFIILS